MMYAICTNFQIRDSSAVLDIFGSVSRSLNSLCHRSNMSCGSRTRSWCVLISQPNIIISPLKILSSNSLFSESAFFLVAGSSFVNGLIEAYIASGTEAAFLLIMDRQSKNTLIISSKKQSPQPSDVVGTSTAIALAGAIGMSGSMYTAVGTLGCIGLKKCPDPSHQSRFFF